MIRRLWKWVLSFFRRSPAPPQTGMPIPGEASVSVPGLLDRFAQGFRHGTRDSRKRWGWFARFDRGGQRYYYLRGKKGTWYSPTRQAKKATGLRGRQWVRAVREARKVSRQTRG